MDRLSSIPPELLEHIAFYAATGSLVGPPSGIVPLLCTNYHAHATLALDANPSLWARIFAAKFDLAPAVRRLGVARTTPMAIAHELRTRFVFLRRMRARQDVLAPPFELSEGHKQLLVSTLWMAYLMMLENEGLNERQLREYASVDEWLRDYLFHPDGASLLRRVVKQDDYMTDDTSFHDATGVLKLLALGAHRYDLSLPSWKDFVLPYRLKSSLDPLVYFATPLRMLPPPPAAPAILSYLTLTNKLSVSWDTISYMKPPDPTLPSLGGASSSTEWDAEWVRMERLAEATREVGENVVEGAFVPGSLKGSWEGLFTYTEFTAYAALLSGAQPNILERSLVAQHPQIWKLREHHFYAPAPASPGLSFSASYDTDPDFDEDAHDTPTLAHADTKESSSNAQPQPLSPGSALRAYFPQDTQLHEGPDGLEVREPGRPPVLYESWGRIDARDGKPSGVVSGMGKRRRRQLMDVIITGEGHSAWGQFNILGRVRPCDGFMAFSKDYMNGDRGRWLYRGYLIGNEHGNLAGRWRDTLSPPDVLGYEGCFVMSRRK